MPQIAQTPTVSDVTGGFGIALQTIRQNTILLARSSIEKGYFFDDAEVDKIVHNITPTVIAALSQTTDLSNAYVSTLATLAGVQTRPSAVKGNMGVEQVAGKVGTTVTSIFYRLSQGYSFEDARDMTSRSMDGFIHDAIQSTSDHVVAHSSEQNGATLFHRVAQSANPCELCLAAADNTYHTADLAPIHDHCSCTVEPAF